MTTCSVFKRLAALFLAVAILLATVPLFSLPLAASAADTRVVDPSTMNDWQNYFGKHMLSTQNAGGVWTDKSVFVNADAFEGTGVTLGGADNESFLVALSAIASNSAIKGFSNVPTDTMLVLDLSGSMYNDGVKDPSTVQTMLDSVNRVIDELQNLNAYNRVGVVVYYGGGDYLPSTIAHAKVLLPLDRYSNIEAVYLKTTVSGGKLVSVNVNENVTNAAGMTVSGSHIPADAAGTYLQLGILNALDELLAADPKVPATADYMAGQTRLPIMVVMSDGEPTAATADYTARETAGMGNNTVSLRNAAQTDFVTQLTAAYAKVVLDEHYKDTTPLFFTLSLGGETGRDVMDPEASDARSLAVIADPDSYTADENTDALNNRAIDAYWNMLTEDGAVDITVQNCKSQWDAATVDASYTVSTVSVTVDGETVTFPQDKSAKYYVDESFSAADADGLADAFDAVFAAIDLRSHYFPTLVEENEDVSGYISFRDMIGEYMSITDIKGILIDNVLFSGAMLSKNFITGGGELGTFDKPTSLGDELVWAVQARLGIDVNTARDLLGLAYAHKQLSYDTATGAFSNYIGWYANASEEYIGFWYDGIETMPDPHDESLAENERPRYVMRSYGFLGAVDAEHGVSQTDMMYAVVQIRYDLLTGDEMMLFEIPAALIPTVTYTITLDENGEPKDLEASGADHPIRLVYEVALDDEIDELSVTELVADGYAHKNADGTYGFYTNQFDTNGDLGYTTPNTRSAFVPSKQNERFYYTEDSLVYVDANGTPYTGDTIDPNGEFYRGYTVYSKNGALSAKTMYERISVASLTGDNIEKREDGYWYILAGTVHTMLEGFVVDKTTNSTDSLPWSNVPFVDTQYTYYTGATLGNNGCLTLSPATGIKLSKTVEGEAADEHFRFTITAADATESATYDAVIRTANGEKTPASVTFTDGVAAVELCSGETMYIVGMTAGAVYTVTENAHGDYKLVSVNGDETAEAIELTVEAHTYAEATFTNTAKGYGNVTIVKRVIHDLGTTYVMPDKLFEMHVSIGAAYAGQTIEASYSGDSGIASVTADENGEFTIYLKNTEQYELIGLKEGTVVTVEEINVPDGFTPIYYGAGVLDQNYVTVREKAAVSILVFNRYTPEEVSNVNITVGGTKALKGRENDAWLDTDVYEFALQKNSGDGWVTIATATVDKEQRDFGFTDAMKAEVFTAPGFYSYQVVEVPGSVSDVLYDRHIYTFTVVIGDPQMNGKLEVIDVIAHEGADHISGNATDGWMITTDFTNTYSTTGKAVAVIDIEKLLVNPSQSDRVNLSGFRFGLYEDGATVPAFLSSATDMMGETRIVAEYEQNGVYTYTLKEIAPETIIAGMTCSTEEYAVTVTVSDNDDGTRDATVTITKDGKPLSIVPTFTNSYEPAAAEITLPVKKVLMGRTLRDGEFTFDIRSDGSVVATGTNDVHGVVTFDKALSFDKLGDYYFDVVEAPGDVAGVTYDDFVYRVHVRVTDGGNGSLEAHAHVINVVAETMVFTNIYKAAPASLVIEGQKTLVGRKLINDEFAFVLVEEGDIGLIMTTRNYASGVFRFGPLTYTKAGVYRYFLCEVQSTTTHGITFDDSQFDVVVTVIDEGDGQLHASYTVTENGEPVEELSFVNHYIPTPVDIPLVGVKSLTGCVLGDGEFEFVLYEADARWQAGDVIDTVTNAADGTFAFEPLTITSGGTYRYLVKETCGGQTIDGVTYDDGVYRVLLVATDDNRGSLHINKVIFDRNNVYTTVMSFENTYTTTTTTTGGGNVPSTTLSGNTTETTAIHPSSPQSPQTGECRDLTAWVALLFVSGGVFTTLAAVEKKKLHAK